MIFNLTVGEGVAVSGLVIESEGRLLGHTKRGKKRLQPGRAKGGARHEDRIDNAAIKERLNFKKIEFERNSFRII